MTRPTNPYIAGAPLRGERGFFGREVTLNWVTQELNNPSTNALVLFGQRRIGKTTLLLQLEQALSADRFLPVYFDLQDQATRPLGEVLADLADTLAEYAKLDPPDPDEFDDRGRHFRRTFLSQLYEAIGDRRPVFLLDEFDVLDQLAEAGLPALAAAKGLFPFLRRLMLDEPRLAFVFVVGRRAEDLTLDFSATFKASLTREVWTLDEASAKGLVRQAETEGTLCYDDEAVQRILSVTSRHPYLTQLLCQRIWERAYSNGHASVPQVTVEDVNAAIDDALGAGYQAFAWIWDGLSPAERICAAAFAEQTSPDEALSEQQVIEVLATHAARLRTREVELAPRDLVQRRVLAQVNEHRYRYNVELFRLWVQRNKPLREVKDQLDQMDPLADQTYEMGSRFFQRGAWEIAVRYFRDALSANPRHFRARLHMGEALLADGKTQEAVDELEQAYTLDREEARLPLARAIVAHAQNLADSNAGDKALQALDRVLKISPSEPTALMLQSQIWTRRGQDALNQGRLKEAIEAFKEAGDEEQLTRVEERQLREKLGSLENKARSAYFQGRWVEAASGYEDLLGLEPDPEKREEWRQKLDSSRQELEMSSAFAEGIGRLEQKDWSGARNALSRVMRINPNYSKDGKLAAGLFYQAVLERSRIVNRRWFYVGGAVILILLATTIGLYSWGADRDSTANSYWSRYWDARTQLEEANQIIEAHENGLLRHWETHYSRIRDITFSTDGSMLASASDDNRITVAEVESGLMVLEPFDVSSDVNSIAFSPDGRSLAFGTDDHSLRVLTLFSLSVEMELTELASAITSVAYSPSGTILVAGSDDGTLRILRAADASPIEELVAHDAGITAISFSPDGSFLATASEDNTARLWSVADWSLLNTLAAGTEGSSATVTDVAFAADGNTLYTGTSDGILQSWLPSDGSLLKTVESESAIRSIASAPNGQYVATGSDDATVVRWEPRLGESIGSPMAHTHSVEAIDISPDGTVLAAGLYDGSVWLWEVGE